MKKRFIFQLLGVVSSTFVASRSTGIRYAADNVCLLPAVSLRVLRNGRLTSS
jgi:hypothetical protein